MTSSFNGLSGGSNFSNSKTKDDKKKSVKEYPVYKYNKDIPLAEQIIIGNKSVFLQIDNDGKPVISVRLDLSKDQDLILIPQQDGIGGIASYTLPIKFKDLTEIKSFIEAAQQQTIDFIYLQHKKLWRKFVVANDEHTISFLAMDSVYSHFQDLFETTHSDLIDGAPGSGKGATLITFQLLGYRVVLAADLSGANILDLYGSNGRCQITLAEDELDDIKDDTIKRKLYKIGYDITGKTPRTLDGNTSSRASRLYEIFGLKIFGTEVASDDKMLGGFNDRNFRIESTKGKPEFRVKKVLMEMEKPIERQSLKYKQIVSEVEYVRKLTFIFRMIHYNNMIEEVETNIDGRPLELTGPQIYLFASRELGSSYRIASSDDQRKDSLLMKEILPTLTEFLKKKGQLTEKTLQSVIWDAFKLLVSSEPNEKLIHKTVREITTGKIRSLIEIGYDLIYDKVRVITEGKDSINLNEQAFYSADCGKITHRQILKICKSPFRGEAGRIDISTGNRRIQTKSLTFDTEIIRKVGKTFEPITKIEILENEASKEGESDVTEQRNFGEYRDIQENQRLNIVEQSEQNKIKVSSNYTNSAEKLKKPLGTHNFNINTIEIEDGSHIVECTKDNSGVYTSTTSNSVAQLQEQPQTQNFRKENVTQYGNAKGLVSAPDPSLAQTTRFLNNLREDYDEYQCSTCQHKEAIWKNNTKALTCPKCKSSVLRSLGSKCEKWFT
ncbi:MAG: hypothetical protein ACRD8W_01635 [Nitrososphaeraceae archaeon]